MRIIIVTLLLSLISLSLGDGVRLGGRRESPMEEEIEVEGVGVETETAVPTIIETGLPTSEETCCSCPYIPEDATEEEICLIMGDMGQGCDSICVEDGDGPTRDRNLQDMSVHTQVPAPAPIPEVTPSPLPWWKPAPKPTRCAGPSTKRSRSLQFGCGAYFPTWKPLEFCYGAVKFIGCNLSVVRWIPEDDGTPDGNSMPPHPMPGNDIWYHSDGLCFFGQSAFWKIPDYCEVTFDCKGKKLDVLFDANGDWSFSVKPKVRCEPIQSCGSRIFGISVPTPQWEEDHGKWPDCINTINWV